MSLIFHLLEWPLLIVILIFVILIYKKVTSTTDHFANCVGVQYNGLPFLENKTTPVCTQGIKSMYPDGGCLVYNPDDVAIAYAKGAFRPAV